MIAAVVIDGWESDMGVMGENAILTQAKKGQGETNQRLDALVVEQRVTNALLRELLDVLRSSAVR